MKATLLLVANVVVILVLLNSIYRFLRSPEGEQRSTRLAAGFSAVLTLAIGCMLYSGEFRRNSDLATAHWIHNRTTRIHLLNALRDTDHLFTRLANELNPGPNVGYRPHPSLWPIVVLVAAYIIRLLVYLTFERTGRLREAANTTSVYWSHFSCYAFIIAFMALIVNWNPIVVITASLFVLVILLVGGVFFVEDVLFALNSITLLTRRAITRTGRELATAAAAIAMGVRVFFEDGQAWYLNNIRARIRSGASVVTEAAEKIDETGKARARAQNDKHALRFGPSRRSRS